ncbi:MAG: hypothetical protein WBC05_11505 [Sedimentisphaerales bacterium]
MKENEVVRIRDVCHQVDLLVSSDPGAKKWEFLDRARLRMNELVYKQKWLEAECMAYSITLMHAGQKGEDYLLAEGLD